MLRNQKDGIIIWGFNMGTISDKLVKRTSVLFLKFRNISNYLKTFGMYKLFAVVKVTMKNKIGDI